MSTARLADVIGSHPENETDHRATLYPEALIGDEVPRGPGCAIRFSQLTLEGLMSCRDVPVEWVWGEQIDAHAPQF